MNNFFQLPVVETTTGNWVHIPDYEGMYQATMTGLIRSIDRFVPHSRLGQQFVRGRIIIPHLDQDGYARVQLCKLGQIKLWGIHQLAARTFIPNPESKLSINHKDGVKTNNCVTNLEWVTGRENEEHAVRNRLKARGQRNGNSKLTLDQVIIIKDRLKKVKIRGIQTGDGNGDTILKIATDFGISVAAVHLIRLGHVWVDV